MKVNITDNRTNVDPDESRKSEVIVRALAHAASVSSAKKSSTVGFLSRALDITTAEVERLEKGSTQVTYTLVANTSDVSGKAFLEAVKDLGALKSLTMVLDDVPTPRPRTPRKAVAATGGAK